jgi:hypothetical protein
VAGIAELVKTVFTSNEIQRLRAVFVYKILEFCFY